MLDAMKGKTAVRVITEGFPGVKAGYVPSHMIQCLQKEEKWKQDILVLILSRAASPYFVS